MEFEVLKSELDASVNFVAKIGPGEALEARYVRRHKDYVACYLSCQTACEQACRQCHLTATGQNHGRDASEREMLEQAELILDHYFEAGEPAKTIHFNFMARGEPLVNETILRGARAFFTELGRRALLSGLNPLFLVSSIIPESMGDRKFSDIFPIIHPELYYSLYSLRPEFRRRWLPRAMDPYQALDKLTEWHHFTTKVPHIHFPLIAGENDNPDEAFAIISEVRKRGLRADFTLVRYNPPNERTGTESDNYERYANCLRSAMPEARIKVVERVGFDVHASCGTFLNVQ